MWSLKGELQWLCVRGMMLERQIAIGAKETWTEIETRVVAVGSWRQYVQYNVNFRKQNILSCLFLVQSTPIGNCTFCRLNKSYSTFVPYSGICYSKSFPEDLKSSWKCPDILIYSWDPPLLPGFWVEWYMVLFYFKNIFCGIHILKKKRRKGKTYSDRLQPLLKRCQWLLCHLGKIPLITVRFKLRPNTWSDVWCVVENCWWLMAYSVSSSSKLSGFVFPCSLFSLFSKTPSPRGLFAFAFSNQGFSKST